MTRYHQCYDPEGFCFLLEKVAYNMRDTLFGNPGRRIGAATWGRPPVTIVRKERPTSKRMSRRGELLA